MHAIRAWATERHLHIESPAEPTPDPHTDPLAVFDRPDPADRSYRYALTRIWNQDLPPVTYVMLNPSTAGAAHPRDDDRTIGRCRTFARAAGYGSLTVVNLFALIETKPQRLALHHDPVGPENDDLLDLISGSDEPLILAWGTHHSRLLDRSRTVLGRLTARSHPVLAFGHNRDGSPKHPLYLSGATPLAPFTGCADPAPRPGTAEATQ